MRILGIDPGEKRIGAALSDPTATIAKPLTVIEHTKRNIDAASIAQLAQDNDVGLIVIGQALDIDGKPNLSGRRAARLAGALGTQTTIPIVLWDEFQSTQQALEAQIQANVPQKKRRGHLDEYAAMAILQSYLDAHGDKI
jgi:putative Holliday junction resolvase